MTFIRNFMWSSGRSVRFRLSDLLRPARGFCTPGEALFHTGWFVESLATQVLVIFVIRTRGNPLSSRPHPWLMATSLGVVATAVALPFTTAGAALGLVPLPLGFFGVLAALVVVYLLAVEAVKRVFYRRFAV